MNYYLFRNFETEEAESVYATEYGVAFQGEPYTQLISQAEFETYIAFGIPETKAVTGTKYERIQ